MVSQALSMGKEPDASPHPLLMHTDTAHTVENLKKLNFEVLEHPLYNLDLTPSDSPVWSTALVFLNTKHTVRITIKSHSYISSCYLREVWCVFKQTHMSYKVSRVCLERQNVITSIHRLTQIFNASLRG
jgi:hypothetical protein